MDASTTLEFGIAAIGRWTIADGPARADRLPWSSRQTAGPLARMAAHALDALWAGGEPDRPLSLVLASAHGEPTATDPWCALADPLARIDGVARVIPVSAAHQTVPAALWWASPDESLVVLWADVAATTELAVALWLHPEGDLARLGAPVRQAHAPPRRPSANPCIGALRLAEACANGGTVRLDADRGASDPGVAWCSVVQPGRRAPGQSDRRA